MDHLDNYEKMLRILTEPVEIDGKSYILKDEFEKLYVNGNKRAATRIRKIMQSIKNAAQDVRNEVQEYRKKI
jgi:hypothetical protein